MYTGTTPATARGIAPELLKAPDRRRTLASAGLLFFSYLYIYISQFFVALTISSLYSSLIIFSPFKRKKVLSLSSLFSFSFSFFYLFFTVHKKRTKYYSAHKLVGFAPTHTQTNTPNNNNITDVSTDVYIHYISH